MFILTSLYFLTDSLHMYNIHLLGPFNLSTKYLPITYWQKPSESLVLIFACDVLTQVYVACCVALHTYLYISCSFCIVDLLRRTRFVIYTHVCQHSSCLWYLCFVVVGFFSLYFYLYSTHSERNYAVSLKYTIC